MYKTRITLFLAGGAFAAAFGVHAQSAPGGDMSRYESIDAPSKSNRNHPTASVAPKGIQPGKHVETIGPSNSQIIGRGAAGLGMSTAPQPVIRPGVPMTAGGTVRVAPGIVDKVPPQPASNADLPVPRQRTTEMITEDAQGEVIDRTTVFR